MLLSPEFSLGGVAGRAVVLRLDDIFLLIILLGWFTKSAVNKEVGMIKITPLNKPIWLYSVFYLIATLVGILMSSVNIKEGLFYFLKYSEYFLLYFMVCNILKNREQAKFFIYAMVFVALITSAYACYEHYIGIARVSAPFEGKSGEANTLGGYLVLIIAIVSSLILNVSLIRTKVLLGVSLVVMFAALLFTLSRGSWIACCAAFLGLMFFSRKGKWFLVVVSVLLIPFFTVVVPRFVFERIRYTFEAQVERKLMGRRIFMDLATAERIDTLTNSILKWKKSPFLGSGASSAGATADNQYARLLIETGVIGVFLFLNIMVAIFKSSLRSRARLKDSDFFYALASGFIAGYIGLIVHSLGAATFILIRIMEPFWFLTAIVIMLPELEQSSELFKG
ncbi:MAG: O-antigen ligase family protein [Candidatus Omnitrophica bacterium]|nr:O-antigen ligase family protein [Candidatus Omnitrophota bacterium]